jgi:hypothetical protein
MKIEYDAAHDLLNIEFLANVPIDDSVEMDGVVIDTQKTSESSPSKCSTQASERRANRWT